MARAAAVLSLLALTVLATDAAHGANLRVAMDGSDGPTCGAKKAPCRTITQALENAKPGDRIRVAPGRYGDLNGYPIDLGGPGPVEGEESGGGQPSCDCYLDLDKPITVESEEGPAATILHGGSRFGSNGCEEGGSPYANATDVVRISSDGVTLGGKGRGFTIVGGCRGVFLPLPDGDGVREKVRIEGNLFAGLQRIGVGMAYNILCRGCVLRGNVFTGNQRRLNRQTVVHPYEDAEIRENAWIAEVQGEVEHIWLVSDSKVERNLSIAKGRDGIPRASGSVRGNVATLNSFAGFQRLRGKVQDNFATANRRGFREVGGPSYRKNHAIGNTGPGLSALSGGASFVKGNVFGNGVGEPSVSLPATNCGADIKTGSPDLSGNFWGDAAGPGAEPGDRVCADEAESPSRKVRKPKRFKRKPTL